MDLDKYIQTMQAFNRTIVELKYMTEEEIWTYAFAFNRTIVELKWKR